MKRQKQKKKTKKLQWTAPVLVTFGSAHGAPNPSCNPSGSAAISCGGTGILPLSCWPEGAGAA